MDNNSSINSKALCQATFNYHADHATKSASGKITVANQTSQAITNKGGDDAKQLLAPQHSIIDSDDDVEQMAMTARNANSPQHPQATTTRLFQEAQLF